MTPLQVLRAALKAGAIVTMYHVPDGYRIEVTEVDADGATVLWEIIDSRLDQAIQQLREYMAEHDVT